ncbi:MAG TPA: Ku protein [Pirellulales bacterium]|nr:Ku protein [Pirellulales bacterium]
MARPSWRGYLRLSLVAVPIEAYPAAAPGKGEVHLNQLHEECHSRIRYKKFCPIHGEVPNDEIVQGYEYAKDQYVVIEPSEREAFRTKSERAMNIDRFVPLDSVDPFYFSGRNYYLLPDGASGEKPYRVLGQAMADEECCAVGQIVFSGREEVALVRPVETVLTMSLLNYASQLKPLSDFSGEVADDRARADELKLARTLIQQTTSAEANLEQYRDTYTEQFKAAIEAKVEGREVVMPAAEEEAPIVNLMDALRNSLKRKGRAAASERTARHAPAAARRRRKTS